MEHQQTERRRGAWCGRCPHCGSAAVTWASPWDLACDTCRRVIRTADARAQAETEVALEAGAQYWRPGRMSDWVERADAALDKARAENVRRIEELWATRKRLLVLLNGTRCKVWSTVLRWLGLEVENARARRGGRDEDVVRPHRARSTAYAGLGHALAAATYASTLGGGSPQLGGATARYRLPRGVVLGQMAVAPSHASSGRARGEGAVLDRVDLEKALRAAGISEIDAELLALVEVGQTRQRARRTRNGVEPAVEPLRPVDALATLRTRHPGRVDLPATVHEARLRLRRARGAVREALAARGLVAPHERRPGPRAPDLRDVTRIDPLEALQ